MIICPKCGISLSGKEEFCVFCGASLTNKPPRITPENPSNEVKPPLSPDFTPSLDPQPTDDPFKKQEKPANKNTLIIVSAVFVLFLLIAGIGTVVYMNSPGTKYNKAVKAMNAKDYETAKTIFDQISDYEDSKKLSETCAHKIDLANDKEAPVISGIDSEINITSGTSFNLKEYVKNHVKITDNLSGELSDYSLTCTDSSYDSSTGDLDTSMVTSFKFGINCLDEAGNVGSLSSTIHINPVYLTKKNRTPVIYDGKYAKVKVTAFEHGTFYEDDGEEYRVTLKITNRHDNVIRVFFANNNTRINNTKVTTYYTNKTIRSGETGTVSCSIYKKDIPSSVKNFKKIITEVCISTDLNAKKEVSVYDSFILSIDVDAAK